MADEESVDMEQPRDEQPPPESGPPALIAPAGKLSPVQQAQYRRRAHTATCKQCADIDRRLCAEGEQLLQAWNAAIEDAYRRLHGAR